MERRGRTTTGGAQAPWTVREFGSEENGVFILALVCLFACFVCRLVVTCLICVVFLCADVKEEGDLHFGDTCS